MKQNLLTHILRLTILFLLFFGVGTGSAVGATGLECGDAKPAISYEGTSVGAETNSAIIAQRLTDWGIPSPQFDQLKLDLDAGGIPLKKFFADEGESGLKAWEKVIGRDYSTDVPFLEKLSEILQPSVLNKLPNGEADLDVIITALVHPHTGASHTFMKQAAEHLDDVKYLINNFDGVQGFDQVITALKNPNFFAQDGASHMLTKLKELDPLAVTKLEGKIVDADNLDGICINCLFDIEIEISPGVTKKLELKSYSSETIGNIATNSKFKNQFKAYLADVSNIDGFEYIFNGQKTTDLNNIKQNFKTLFQQNNYQIYDDIENVNPGLWNSLGIDDIGDFASLVDNLDPSLYKFIDILN